MARTENRNSRTTEDIARIDGYHAGGGWGGEQYARLGFSGPFSIYTSDRRIEFLPDMKTLVNGKPAKGYGLEIETECQSITRDTVLANIFKHVIFPKFPENLFKMQSDGSLRGRTSAECITMPMTKEGLRNLYPAFKQMFDDYFPEFEISCDSGNCGMHVNISTACFGAKEETQAAAIRKLYYIINKHFDLMKHLVNRTGSTGYCAKMDYTIAKTMDLHNQYCSHHVCFNLGHYDSGRIEIRLVGGQKNFPCFRNTMEVVFHLVDAVKKLSWAECDDVRAIFAGCNQYVVSRLRSHGLRTGNLSEEDFTAIKDSATEEDSIL